uniref:Uncharacterized protein n=1 Tax=Anguilla anguilla TaxID=7936 RepID=A0A0E9RQS9_ANGAN
MCGCITLHRSADSTSPVQEWHVSCMCQFRSCE